MTTHSIAYLAGVGAAALGLSASDCPIRCDDHDAYGDLLNGLRDEVRATDSDGHSFDDYRGTIEDLESDAADAVRAVAEVLDNVSKRTDLDSAIRAAIDRIKAAEVELRDIAAALGMPDDGTPEPDDVIAAAKKLREAVDRPRVIGVDFANKPDRAARASVKA